MNARRPSPATVIAVVALVVALSAPAWAAPVGDLIKGKDIARNAITSPKVKNRSLLAKDFKRGQLPRGPKGAKGETGATGPQGVPGPSLTGGAYDTSGTIGPIAGSMTDLAAAATTTGQLVLPWQGRITAEGFADVVNATSGPAEITRTRCNLFISDGTGPDNGLTAFSPNAFGDTPATNNYHVAIPLTGWVVKPPGTYNIAVRCTTVTGVTVSHTASLSYTAVPSP